MIVKEISAKSCMTRSKLPGCDYVINPYTGCQHGCKYCYAVFMKRFQNIKEDWGDFVYVKINSPELLVKELEINGPGNIFMSSVTDCYAPIEGKYQLTRKILETIANSRYKNKFHVEILTKSALIKRDFDVIKRLDTVIGCSINSLDNDAARILEPFASPPTLRLQVLKDAKSRGIEVYGFISPVLPGITDLEVLFKELSFCDYVWVELLNTKKDAMDRLIPVIEANFPDKLKDFEYIQNNPKAYYEKISAQVRMLEKKYRLEVREIVVHNV